MGGLVIEFPLGDCDSHSKQVQPPIIHSALHELQIASFFPFASPGRSVTASASFPRDSCDLFHLTRSLSMIVQGTTD